MDPSPSGGGYVDPEVINFFKSLNCEQVPNIDGADGASAALHDQDGDEDEGHLAGGGDEHDRPEEDHGVVHPERHRRKPDEAVSPAEDDNLQPPATPPPPPPVLEGVAASSTSSTSAFRPPDRVPPAMLLQPSAEEEEEEQVRAKDFDLPAALLQEDKLLKEAKNEKVSASPGKRRASPAGQEPTDDATCSSPPAKRQLIGQASSASSAQSPTPTVASNPSELTSGGEPGARAHKPRPPPSSGVSSSAAVATDDDQLLKPVQMVATSLTDAEGKIRLYERQFGDKYRKQKCPRGFGQSDDISDLQKKKLYWHNRVPFIKASSDCCVYECHLGKDHDVNRKQQRRKENEVADKHRPSPSRTKKEGCPAKILLEERIAFPDYKLPEPSQQSASLLTLTRKARAELRQKLLERSGPCSRLSDSDLKTERQIHLSFSGTHTHAPLAAADGSAEAVIAQQQQQTKPAGAHLADLDVQVANYIHRLVWSGQRDVGQIRSKLVRWICRRLSSAATGLVCGVGVGTGEDDSDDEDLDDAQMLLAAPMPLGRTVPTKKDIHNHITTARRNVKNYQADMTAFVSSKFLDDWQRDHPKGILHFAERRFSKGMSLNSARTGEEGSMPTKLAKSQHSASDESMVFLMDDSGKIIAFGQKTEHPQQGQVKSEELQTVWLTHVLSPADPSSGRSLVEHTHVQWPVQLILDVIVELPEGADGGGGGGGGDDVQGRSGQASLQNDDTAEENVTKVADDEKEEFFAASTEFQQDLLVKYGRDVLLLDLLCHAPRSDLCVVLLRVPAPWDDQFEPVCLLLLTSHNLKRSLTAGLTWLTGQLRERDADWLPAHVIASSIDQSVLAAAESVWPGCLCVVSDSARRRLWERRFALLAAADVSKSNVLTLRTSMGAMADAISSSEYEEWRRYTDAVLKEIDNRSMTDYWSKVWLPCPERWATHFRPIRLIAHTKPLLELDLDRLDKVDVHAGLDDMTIRCIIKPCAGKFCLTKRVVGVSTLIRFVLAHYFPHAENYARERAEGAEEDSVRTLFSPPTSAPLDAAVKRFREAVLVAKSLDKMGGRREAELIEKLEEVTAEALRSASEEIISC